MAQEGRDTAEFKAFVSCTSKIVNTVKSDLSIADKLLEEGLISEETYDEIALSNSITDRTKARKIFTNVREKVKLSTGNFNVFCDILEESLFYLDLLSRLKGKLFTWNLFLRMPTILATVLLKEAPLLFIEVIGHTNSVSRLLPAKRGCGRSLSFNSG